MKAIDIVIIVVVAAAFVAVVGTMIYKKIKQKKDGTCGGMCSGCPYHSNCQSKAKVSREKYDKTHNLEK